MTIKNLEKDSGVVYVEVSFDRNSAAQYFDCGQHGLTQVSYVKANMNVFVESLSKNKSRSTVNIKAWAVKRLGDYPPITVECTSTGLAEERILAGMEK